MNLVKICTSVSGRQIIQNLVAARYGWLKIKVAVAPLLDVVATAEDLDLGHDHAPDQGHVLALVRQKDDQGLCPVLRVVQPQGPLHVPRSSLVHHPRPLHEVHHLVGSGKTVTTDHAHYGTDCFTLIVPNFCKATALIALTLIKLC